MLTDKAKAEIRNIQDDTLSGIIEYLNGYKDILWTYKENEDSANMLDFIIQELKTVRRCDIDKYREYKF